MRQLLHRDLINITVANTLRHFGGALVEVFVPLLLLQHGLSLTAVCLFYLVYAVTKLIINYPAMRFINRLGASRGLIAGRLAYIGYLLCLVAIVDGQAVALAWPMAMLLALTYAFQWNAQHLHVSRVINMERKGQDIARIDAIDTLAASLAPAASAALALILGTSWPLYIAILTILGSIYWLRHIDGEAGGHQPVERINYSLKNAPARDVVANFAFNVHTGVGVIIWPIYLAVTLANINAIGLAASVSAVLAAGFLIFIGNRNDSAGTMKVLREGSLSTLAAHLLRLFPVTALSATIINLTWLLALRYQQNPWASVYYAHTRQRGVDYIMSMEIACDLAYVALFAGFYALLMVAPPLTAFMILFIIAAVMSVVPVIITAPVVSTDAKTK